MPQLEIHTYPSQIFWLIVCFFTLYIVMANMIIPRIADIIEQRRKKINDAIDKANELKKKAEISLEKYQAALAAATAEADKSLNKTQDELNKLIENKQTELEESLKEKIAADETEIRKSKEAALKEVKTLSEKLALDVVKKIGLKEISPQQIKSALKKIEEK